MEFWNNYQVSCTILQILLPFNRFLFLFLFHGEVLLFLVSANICNFDSLPYLHSKQFINGLGLSTQYHLEHPPPLCQPKSRQDIDYNNFHFFFPSFLQTNAQHRKWLSLKTPKKILKMKAAKTKTKTKTERKMCKKNHIIPNSSISMLCNLQLCVIIFCPKHFMTNQLLAIW